MKNETLSILEKVKNGELTLQIAQEQLFILFDVSESSLKIPDIRNKLTPLTHLISVAELGDTEYVKKAIPQAKKSINYLAQRDVYSR